MLEADFVTTDEGTGLVHTAIAFGEDDFRLGEQYGITLQNPVLPDGTFDERVTDYAGRSVKEADPDIVEALRESGRLLRSEVYEHAYPHCWRCDTPLLYYAKSSWYVKTTEVRDRMLAENERIGWHPEHIKHGRFGKWLEGNSGLGALPRALLGHAAPDLAVRVGRVRRVVLRGLGGRPARRAAARFPTTCTARISTTWCSMLRSAAARRCGASRR